MAYGYSAIVTMVPTGAATARCRTIPLTLTVSTTRHDFREALCVKDPSLAVAFDHIEENENCDGCQIPLGAIMDAEIAMAALDNHSIINGVIVPDHVAENVLELRELISESQKAGNATNVFIELY